MVIGPNGTAKPEAGAPDFGSPGISLQPGQSKSTPPWTTVGTYDVSCTIHPTTMNLKVTVTAGASGGTMVTTGPNNYIGGVGGGSACGSSSTPCTITIKKGQTITFLDDKSTGTMHILVIGPNGAAKREPGAPDFGSPGISLQPGQSKSTPPWNTPGTYDVSCTIHPTTMNLRVTVTA
jgi:plastocyanin